MEKEKIIEILLKCREKFEGDKFPEGLSEPHSPEEAAQVYADLAARLGYDLKAEEILELMEAEKEKHKAQTEETAGEIERLTDDEIDAVTGGEGENHVCYDTFKDRENCMSSDGCDKNVTTYSDYKCHNNYNGYQCGSKRAFLNLTYDCGFNYMKQDCESNIAEG